MLAKSIPSVQFGSILFWFRKDQEDVIHTHSLTPYLYPFLWIVLVTVYLIHPREYLASISLSSHPLLYVTLPSILYEGQFKTGHCHHLRQDEQVLLLGRELGSLGRGVKSTRFLTSRAELTRVKARILSELIFIQYSLKSSSSMV